MNGFRRIAPAALLLCALVACGGDATPTGGAKGPAKRAQNVHAQQKARRASGTTASLPTLRLDEAAEPAAAQDTAERPARNLFAFEEDPAVVAERARQAEEARKAAEIASQKAAEARAKQEEALRISPPPPQPPPIPFTFIGYFGPPQARIGVFSMGGGQELILARQGDRIQQKFFVKDVGFESAEIGFEGFTETRRITLTPGS